MSKNVELSSSNEVDKNHIPNPPDPSYPVARFLSWLLKRGGYRNLNDCKNKWGREGLDIEHIIKDFSPNYIRLYVSRGEKIVKLENKPWASQWISYYDLEVPHHRHKKSLEKIFSVTENRTKV